MASIYKRTQDRGKKRAPWYIGYTDHTGKRRSRKGFTDKGATERLAVQIEEQERMIRAGLKDPETGADPNAPLTDHLADFETHLRNRDVSERQVKEVPRKVR